MLVFIHRSITFSKEPSSPESLSDPHLEEPSIEHLLTTTDALILGDFNAHHPSWYSRSTDTRGTKMADSFNGSDYGILNWDSLTRVPPNTEPSSPDVSLALASASLISSCSWQTLSTLSSDHLLILIRLQMKTPSNPGLRRSYVNLKKANWDRYRQEVEAALSKRSLPTYCQRDEKIFLIVILKQHHTTFLLDATDAMRNMYLQRYQRDDLRKRDPT